MQGFRALPSVDQLLQSETGLGLIAEHGRAMVTRTARARLDLARAAIRQGADGAV
nr:L-seryl-tRNA(Sec) selenium transferase [Paracoccus sp. (in: a-proteobacteria)]